MHRSYDSNKDLRSRCLKKLKKDPMTRQVVNGTWISEGQSMYCMYQNMLWIRGELS